MLSILDFTRTKIGVITDYKDLKVERTLDSGDSEISFTYLGSTPIKPEYYVETEDARYTIKESSPDETEASYHGQLDLEDLQRTPFKQFRAYGQTITQAASAALQGTGWTVSTAITSVRNVQKFKALPLDILYAIRDAWMCEIRFDNINNIVYFAESFGEDRGVYMMRGLNLRRATSSIDSYDYVTRIIPYGADGLTIEEVNDGVPYVENYQYSPKILTMIWEDTSYEDAQTLMDDAEKKLEDLSKPKTSYDCDVIDLSKMSSIYSVLDYGLGDVIHLIDDMTGVDDRQRIVRIVEYPETPEKDTCEISNTVLTFEELQARMRAAASAWEEVSNSDGTVNGVYVHGIEADGIVGIETVITNNATVQESIADVQVLYAQGDSATTAPTSGWSTTTPAWDDGKYMWQRTVKTQNSGDITITETNITGATGPTGPSGADGFRGATWYAGTAAVSAIVYSPLLNESGDPLQTENGTALVAGLNGAVIDDSTINAIVGDHYLDVETQDVYVCIHAGIGSAAIWRYEQNIKGETGATGATGEDGLTAHVHFKYSDDGGETFTGNDGEDPGDWLGVYTDYVAEDNTDVSAYTWTKVKGDQGIQGPKGDDGTTYWTWLKYADTPTSGMSDDPTGKDYIGLAYNKTSPTESSVYADYTWSLIKGEKGDQGVPGPDGDDGATLYTWVKYADDASGTNMSDSPTGKKYIGLAYNKTSPTESSTASDYTWALIQGETGTGVSSNAIEYYLSTSDQSQSGGSWSTTVPAYVDGCYYWTRIRTTWTDGSETTSTPVLDNAITGANENASSAITIAGQTYRLEIVTTYSSTGVTDTAHLYVGDIDKAPTMDPLDFAWYRKKKDELEFIGYGLSIFTAKASTNYAQTVLVRWMRTDYVPLLDQNNNPILDQNNNPILAKVEV